MEDDISIIIKEEPSDVTDIEEKISRTRKVLEMEFAREHVERENYIFQIQEQIQFTQKCIKILKYVESCRLYQGEDVKLMPDDNGVDVAIHPCVQMLLPNRNKETMPKTDEEPHEFDRPITSKVILPTLKDQTSDLSFVRGTYRIKHTLIVGNVSKWIPLDVREDEATHKWMLYVRDKGRDDELGSLISKVRYFLHESYKPHDIIEVTSPPFNLTRRGWGEFPVRVMIFFHHPGNKLLDIVHPLKLDKTSAPTQQLGCETNIVIDLLHDNISDLLPENVAKENDIVTDVISLEHDYCAVGGGSVDTENEKRFLLQPQKIISSQNLSESHLSESAILKGWNSMMKLDIATWYEANILERISNIYFLNTEACVKWFLIRWPLITEASTDRHYKLVHPYAFSTMEEFYNSHIGKRHAKEWYLAYRIRQFLLKTNVAPWTTKQIFLYARMHCYVLFLGKPNYKKPAKKYLNISTYTKFFDSNKDMRPVEVPSCEDIDVVDVSTIDVDTSPVKCKSQWTVTTPLVRCVETFSKQIGSRYGYEEIDKTGHETNVAAQIMAHSLNLFLNDLLRKSFSNAWLRNNCKFPGLLMVEDITKTILETPELDFLTNSGLGAKDLS